MGRSYFVVYESQKLNARARGARRKKLGGRGRVGSRGCPLNYVWARPRNPYRY